MLLLIPGPVTTRPEVRAALGHDFAPWDNDFRPLAAGDCIRCHFGEYSRPFVWDQMWPLIKHGKEPPSSGRI